jgi:hypothetical protein
MIGAIIAALTGLPIGHRIAAGAGFAGAIVLAGGVAFLAGQHDGKAKMSADRDAWRRTAGQYLASAKDWEKSFRSSEKIRGQERTEAIQAVNDAGRTCDARVAAARRSTAAIQSIVTKEVRYDESRCPVRAVVGSGELRDALGLAAAGR